MATAYRMLPNVGPHTSRGQYIRNTHTVVCRFCKMLQHSQQTSLVLAPGCAMFRKPLPDAASQAQEIVLASQMAKLLATLYTNARCEYRIKLSLLSWQMWNLSVIRDAPEAPSKRGSPSIAMASSVGSAADDHAMEAQHR